MKKRTKIILGVIIGVLVLYSALMTITVYIAAQEINELETKYRTELADNIETKKNEVDEINKKLDESVKFMQLESFARLIDEKADVITSSDDCAIIRFNIGEKTTEEMVAKLQEYIAFLPSAIKSAELKMCIICAVDKDGDVVFGYTFHPDGTSTTFLGDK